MQIQFIDVPIGIVSNDEEKQEQTVTAKVKPEEIAYTYPGFYTGTVVVMKSGVSFFCRLTQDELHAKIKES